MSNTRQQRARSWKEGGKVTATQYGPREKVKEADVSGTYDMPYHKRNTTPGKRAVNAIPVNKTGAAIYAEMFGETEKTASALEGVLDQWLGRAPRLEESQQRAQVPDPVVEVSKLASVRAPAQAQCYARPDLGMYPLDTPLQVKTASRYFDDFSTSMDPRGRRIFACNLSAQAERFGVGISKKAALLGGDEMVDDGELHTSIAMRKVAAAAHAEACKLYDALYANRTGDVDVMAIALHSIDKLASVQGKVVDPFYTCLAKHAEEEGKDDLIMALGASARMSQLKALAATAEEDLEKKFGEEFAEEFCKDPKGIFDSMPDDDKALILSMASSKASAGTL